MPVRDKPPDLGAPTRTHVVTAKSRFGGIVISWSDFEGAPRVDRVFLPGEIRPPDHLPGSCAPIDSLARLIEAFLDGEDVVLPLHAARLDRCRPFQRAVLTAEYAIPRGRVSTYSSVAMRAGAPGAARAAGTALARNPFPILVPCHRAVRADGSIGGYRGGSRMKRELLRMEGVLFDDSGLVVPALMYC
jgi:methylated-DNA-[protein]-cysteine S-methyltransferase